ncbi:MAG: class B sortase [Lachnospiraceae bacterium]|nr:class B sortase [Lachnospiraceae bacterium]
MGKKGKSGNVVLLRLLMGVFACMFVVSGFMLIRDYVQTSRQQETFDQLNGRFLQAPEPVETVAAGGAPKEKEETGGGAAAADTPLPLKGRIPPQQWKGWWDEAARQRFAVYRSMKEENPDMVGWIRIEGTNIDYPVMHTPDQADFYLHHDFYKKSSSYGTPYLLESCRYEEPRTSLLISGHHMKNGSMFAAIQNYTEEAYFQEHPYIQFDTMDVAGSYEIAAVIKVDASGDQSIWYELLFPQEEGGFQQAWGRVKQKRFYDTGVELGEGDELLALVTCEYTLKDGRLMVIAKRIF